MFNISYPDERRTVNIKLNSSVDLSVDGEGVRALISLRSGEEIRGDRQALLFD